MYTKLVSLSKNLYGLNFKKEAQEILILEGVDPAEIASALGLSPMPEQLCEHHQDEKMQDEADGESDFAELMEKLFGSPDSKEEKDDKDED